jgi:hypothetical protein
VTDDILEELQHALVADKTPWDITVYQKAIDEIERLRAEIARLGSFIHPIGTITYGTNNSAVINYDKLSDNIGDKQ